MPRLSAARTEVIAGLGEQLRFGPRRTLMRQLARIEELAPRIDPAGLYPEDFIVFRVTGYRPEVARPRLVSGEALRGDLSALAERLSESARLTPADLGEPGETVASLMSRWGVTRRTLERYRRLGLVARRVDLGGGRRGLVFSPGGVEAFERVHAARLGRAARFNRIGDAELERLWRRAVRYRARLGWSLNRVAGRLALRSGRSAEGVRRVLRRVDQAREHRVFPEPGPPTTRERMLVVRAVARGIEPSEVAGRSGRRAGAVVRALNHGRADLLRSLGLPVGGDAPSRLTRAEPACSGLTTRAPTDLSTLIARMRERVSPVAYEEHARAAAYRALLGEAGGRVAAMAPAPSGRELDRVETVLRWCALLKVELARTQLRLAIDTLEQRLGGPVDSLPPARAAGLLLGVIAAVCEGVDRFDPARGGRLAAPVGMGVGRWCAGLPDVAIPAPAGQKPVGPVGPGRATRRAPSGIAVADWTALVSPWRVWLGPDPRLQGVLDRLDGPDRDLLTRRFGLGGHAPETLEAVGATVGKHAVHLARAERRAVRRALALARG